MHNDNNNTYINNIHRDTAFGIGNFTTSVRAARRTKLLLSLSYFEIHDL